MLHRSNNQIKRRVDFFFFKFTRILEILVNSAMLLVRKYNYYKENNTQSEALRILCTPHAFYVQYILFVPIYCVIAHYVKFSIYLAIIIFLLEFLHRLMMNIKNIIPTRNFKRRVYLHGCDDENGQSIDGIRVDGVGCNGGAGQ